MCTRSLKCEKLFRNKEYIPLNKLKRERFYYPFVFQIEISCSVYDNNDIKIRLPPPPIKTKQKILFSKGGPGYALTLHLQNKCAYSIASFTIVGQASSSPFCVFDLAASALVGVHHRIDAVMHLLQDLICFLIRKVSQEDIIVPFFVQHLCFFIVVESRRPSADVDLFYWVVRQDVELDVIDELLRQSSIPILFTESLLVQTKLDDIRLLLDAHIEWWQDSKESPRP